MGMVTSLLTAGPHGSTPFSNVTAAFTHKEWRHLVRAPRKGFEEIPEKSRNLVLLGLRFPAWYQLPAGTREKPMDAGGRRPKEYLSRLEDYLNHLQSKTFLKNHSRIQG
ncbi:zinc finger protein 79-like isoform X3 [Myotis lucifugus]|uniref:zinc finger protein 79-like isoform X3 n=1 Tax=Myotis lucifugus TaxID=59463 RepID=UPI000CCC0939|nr:zinc finger protein 79-like isoform X3 [Myotis lucifugus]